jgi:hypothetical protein
MSTFEALGTVLRRYGRFCELYTDRGSHFCRTAKAGEAPAEEQNGQVTQALRALGIRQILARSPEARGRSERAFGTIQGRLPQELRVAGVTDYEAANRYLEELFVPDFNRRFTVAPAQPQSAFVPLAGVDLELLLSIRHERVVRNDNTVTFNRLILQLPTTSDRMHFVRCPVTVHEFPNRTFGVSYQGRLLARYDSHGGPPPHSSPEEKGSTTSGRPRPSPSAAPQRRALARGGASLPLRGAPSRLPRATAVEPDRRLTASIPKTKRRAAQQLRVSGHP